MAIAIKKLFEPSELGIALGSIYILVEGSNSVLENLVIRLVNHTGTAETVTGNLIPSGGTATDANIILSAKSVPANDYLLITVPTMKNGDELQLLAGLANTITIHHESGMPKIP